MTPSQYTHTTLAPSLDDQCRLAAPLYDRYEREARPQPAYIELDSDGEISADWSGEIGNGVPAAVWRRQRLRWYVPSEISGGGLRILIEDLRPLLERVAAGHSVEWDGSNWVGRLSNDAEAADEEIRDRLEQDAQSIETVEVWEAEAWLTGDGGTSAETVLTQAELTIDSTDEQIAAAAAQTRRDAAHDGVHLEGSVTEVYRRLIYQERDRRRDESPATA